MNDLVIEHKKISEKISNYKKRRTLVLVSFFLLGCMIPFLALIPPAEAGGEVPSASGSHFAYWHWSDTIGDMWANTNPDDEDDGSTLTYNIIENQPTSIDLSYTVKANMGDNDLLNEPLHFRENSVINGRAVVEIEAPVETELPEEIHFLAKEWDTDRVQLNVWSETVSYREDGIYRYYIDIDNVTIPSGHEFTVGVNFEVGQGRTNVTIRTSGESYHILPLVERPDENGGNGNGDGGNGDNGTGDNGEDEEDENGDDNTNLIISVIALMGLIILIVVVVAISRRSGK